MSRKYVATMKATDTATVDGKDLRNSLSPLLPILDAFNHRHKNQHRSSHWWSHFSILRRSLKALLSSANRQDALLPRVRWLKTRILPRVYVPFTQLAADNQHAPLGLLLVGLLARINTVLVAALPEDDASAPGTVIETKTKLPIEEEVDRGTTISRGDFARPKSLKVTEPLDAPGPDAADDEPKKILKKKPREVAETEEAPPKRKKKKTKDKHGDDFANMFGSL